jgi:iron complex transport system substrate-binding protein
MRGALALLACLMASLPVSGETAGRPRVVSLDYCADQFVLGLADHEQILAVSPHATRKFSYLRDRAEGLPQVRALAEDVIALKPDLVIRSWGGDARALDFYKRVGIEVVQIGYASDFDGAARVTREIAGALAQEERGETLTERLEAGTTSGEVEALYLTPGGVTAGQGTMVDAIMRAAGLENSIEKQGWVSLPLESLVQNPPDRVLSAFFGFDDDAASNWSLSRHPVMQSILRSADTTALDEARLTCPAWFVADEAKDLREAFEGG